MTALHDVAEMVLEALNLGRAMYPNGGTARDQIDAAMSAFRQAIEANQQAAVSDSLTAQAEPVAWLYRSRDSEWNKHLEWTPGKLGYSGAWDEIPLYTRPQPAQQPTHWIADPKEQHTHCVRDDFYQRGRSAGAYGGYVPVYASSQPPATGLNLRCKSEQKRLASMWGFVPAQQPLTDEQRRQLWRDSPFRGNGGQHDWFIEGTRAAERAHGIGGEE